MAKRRRREETVICPHCGAEIPRRAAACTNCGSDERTGWSENTYLDGIELGGDDEYEEMVAREFGGGRTRPRFPWFYVVIGGVVLAAFILGILRTIL